MAEIVITYPVSGLTVSISVTELGTTPVLFSGTMTSATGSRVYTYSFSESPNTDYEFLATTTGYDDVPGAIYRDGGGLTTLQNEALFSIRVNNGVSGKEVQSIVEKAKKEIIEKVEEIPQTDLTEVNQKLDSIDIAKDSVINMIKSSEKEVCNDIKKEGTTTRKLLNEKTRKLDENVVKLADRQVMTDKIIEDEADEIEEEIEKIFEQEADMIEHEFEIEADQIESELNNQSNGNT